jgi:Saxitoxin biosynthesis operon protein SxtJ
VSRKVLVAIEPEVEREEVTSSSDRSFGYVFSIAFTVIGLWPLLDGRSPRYWALAIACIFLLLAGFAPRILRPLNMLWGRLGALLHRIVTPIVMSVVFFLVVTPLAYIMQALGKDPLRLRWDKNAKSYWIEREPAGPEPQTMTRQF